MTDNDIEEFIKNPLMLIFLCYLGGSIEMTGLPSFIDYGDACKWLKDRGYAKPQPKKHIHNKPCIISKFGKRVLERLENRSILEILNGCHTDSRESFLADFSRLYKEYNDQIDRHKRYPSLSGFNHFPEMNKWHDYSTGLKLSFLVEDWEDLSDKKYRLFLTYFPQI